MDSNFLDIKFYYKKIINIILKSNIKILETIFLEYLQPEYHSSQYYNT